jgi:hypothetical protein
MYLGIRQDGGGFSSRGFPAPAGARLGGVRGNTRATARLRYPSGASAVQLRRRSGPAPLRQRKPAGEIREL